MRNRIKIIIAVAAYAVVVGIIFPRLPVAPVTIDPDCKTVRGAYDDRITFKQCTVPKVKANQND